VTARADAQSGRPGLIDRTRIYRSHRVQQASGIALVDRLVLRGGEHDLIPRLRHRVVDQQPLDDANDLGDSSGSVIALVEAGEAARRCVEVEDVGHHASSFPQAST
jgi:hypothetical protein